MMTSLNPATQHRQHQSWQANLDLQLSSYSDRSGIEGTRLSRCRHQGPLYVQKPFYPEGPDHAHIYLLHPPGGIVSGDSLEITVKANKNAGGLITTPGAARIYRARETHDAQQQLQRQRCKLSIDKNARLEWFPLETIVYNGACVELDTEINLMDGSRYAGWEISCFGLPAANEPFKRGRFLQHYRVLKNGIPLFIERLAIDDASRDVMLNGVPGMQGLPVSGFLLMGPFDNDNSADELLLLRESVQALAVSDVAAISRVGAFYIGRYLGTNAEQARQIFTRWWQQLRPLLFRRDPCVPRIWLT